MIIPIYKPVGASSHQLAHQLGQRLKQKATHTGTLDPLADGVLVVLSGPDRFKKAQLSQTTKTYRTTIISGISTDTEDVLGLIKPRTTQAELPSNLATQLAEYCQTHPPVFKQQVHAFSAARFKGESYFNLAKKKLPVPDKKQQVTLENARMLNSSRITAPELLTTIKSRIKTVRGSFRQAQITEAWSKRLRQSTETFELIELELITSRRFYVRSFIRDFNQQHSVQSCALSITRSQNGEYRISDCICLIQYPNEIR